VSDYNREMLALHLITNTALCLHHPLLDVVQAAVNGGISCIQLREKTLPTREFVALARELKKLLATIPRQIPLIINDRFDVALACGADGVHVGQEDIPVEIIRRWLPGAIVGLSVSSVADIKSVEANQLDIDYLGVGPVFSTPTKLDAAHPIGLDGLALIRSITRLPLVAIGGINSQNAAEVLAAGANGLAVVSAICAARDPEESARRLSTVIQTTVPHKFR
jgi:thiamine-phosphate pyrophosphorylase